METQFGLLVVVVVVKHVAVAAVEFVVGFVAGSVDSHPGHIFVVDVTIVAVGNSQSPADLQRNTLVDSADNKLIVAYIREMYYTGALL